MCKNTYFLILFLFLIHACNTNKKEKGITIAVASNAQFAVEAIAKEFTQQTGISCQITSSSSGKLTAQIKEGAPYDIFISADMKYQHELFQSGLTLEAPKIYALGKIVLWTSQKNINPNIQALTFENIQHIAIANPEIAPYGKASQQILEHYDIYNKVKEKLVFGESIAQTNQFILSGAAQIGFTAQSIVKAPKLQNKGKWFALDANSYTPIQQGIVLLNTSNQKKAQKFYNFLLSNAAQNTLISYGYVLPK